MNSYKDRARKDWGRRSERQYGTYCYSRNTVNSDTPVTVRPYSAASTGGRQTELRVKWQATDAR